MKNSEPNHVLRQTFAVALLIILCGCATSRLVVESNPSGAEVALIRQNQYRMVLGKTPLDLTENANPEVFNGHGYLELSRDQHLTESFTVPKTVFSTNNRYTVLLRPVQLPESCLRQTAAAAALARGVAEAQSFIWKRNYSQAQNTLLKLAESFPNVAVLQDLLGNLYYLQKDVRRALAAYRRSIDLEPNNSQTEQMIEKLSLISGEAHTAASADKER